MKLLCEVNENIRILQEENSETKDQKYFIEGVFMQAEVPNGNDRIYPISVMSEAIKKYDESYIQKGRAVGELNHPDGPKINLDRVSHKILSLTQDGNNYIGKAQLTKGTQAGDIAIGLINNGVKLGVSSRALGALEEGKDGITTVKQMHLITAADIVVDPSAPDAFVEALNEGREWAIRDGKIYETIIKPILKDSIDQATRQERRRKAFIKLIESL